MPVLLYFCLVTTVKFLQGAFYNVPNYTANIMISFIPLMIEGNSLYDALVTSGNLLDVDEAIKVLALESTVSVREYHGVTDIAQFTSLWEGFLSFGGAHIIIIPSGSIVVILAHKNVCLTLFEHLTVIYYLTKARNQAFW